MISLEDITKEFQLLQARSKERKGYSVREISTHLNICKDTVRKLLQRLQDKDLIIIDFEMRPRLDGLLARTPVYRIKRKKS